MTCHWKLNFVLEGIHRSISHFAPLIHFLVRFPLPWDLSWPLLIASSKHSDIQSSRPMGSTGKRLETEIKQDFWIFLLPFPAVALHFWLWLGYIPVWLYHLSCWAPSERLQLTRGSRNTILIFGPFRASRQ